MKNGIQESIHGQIFRDYYFHRTEKEELIQIKKLWSFLKVLSAIHSLAEVFISLLKNNFELTSVQKFDFPLIVLIKSLNLSPKSKYHIKYLGNKRSMIHAFVLW